MTKIAESGQPPDICLLLRVHAEQRWLASRVVPALRQLEAPGALGAEESAAALAYLEVLWLEAGMRAVETDAAAARLREDTDSVLSEKAERYLAAVHRLRLAVDARVRRLTEPRPAGITARQPTGI